jgi:hypothetical protein
MTTTSAAAAAKAAAAVDTTSDIAGLTLVSTAAQAGAWCRLIHADAYLSRHLSAWHEEEGEGCSC